MVPHLPAAPGHCPSTAFRRGHAVCSTPRQMFARSASRQAIGLASTQWPHLELGEALVSGPSSHTSTSPDAAPHHPPAGASEHQPPSTTGITTHSNNILSFSPSSPRSSSSSSSGGGGGGGRPFSAMRPLSGKAARPLQDGDVQRRITLDIKCTSTWQQAGRLFERSSDSFNHINTTALLTHLAKLPAPPQPPIPPSHLDHPEWTGTSAPAMPGRMWAPHATTSSWATQPTAWAPQGHASSAAAEEWDSYQSLLEELQVFAEYMLPKMGPRELANTTHSFVTMHMASRRYLQLVLAHSGRKLDGFKPQEIANLIWALAKAEHPVPPEWMDTCVSGPLTQFTSSFRNQELVNVIWALAKLGHKPDPRWLAGAVDVLLSRLDTLCCQDVANLLFGLAKLRHRLRGSQLQLLLAAAQRSSTNRMSAHELSQILWAVGEMKPSSMLPLLPFLHFAASYFQSSAQHLAATAPNYLASSLASMARLRYCPDQRTCAAVLQALQPRLQHCGGVDLGDLLWAVATMQRLGQGASDAGDLDVSSSSSSAMDPGPRWLAAAESACSAVLPSCGPRALCRQGWAFAVMGHVPGSSWVEGYKEQISRCVQACNDAEVAIMLWSLAKLGIRDSSPMASWTARCVLELVEKVERKQQREQRLVQRSDSSRAARGTQAQGSEVDEETESAGGEQREQRLVQRSDSSRAAGGKQAQGSEVGEETESTVGEQPRSEVGAKKKLLGRRRKVERRRGAVSAAYFKLHWRQQKQLQMVDRAKRAQLHAKRARKLQHQQHQHQQQLQQQREAAAELARQAVRCDLGPGPLLRLRHLAFVVWALPRLLPLPGDRRVFVSEHHNLLRRMEAACVQPLRICSSCWGTQPGQAASAPPGPSGPGTLVLLASGFAAMSHQPSWTWLRAHHGACVALSPRFSSREVQVLRAACSALHHNASTAQAQAALAAAPHTPGS